MGTGFQLEAQLNVLLRAGYIRSAGKFNGEKRTYTLTVESHDAVTKMPSFQDKHETKIQLQNTNNWIFFYHFQTQSGLKTLTKKFPYSFNHNVLEY